MYEFIVESLYMYNQEIFVNQLRILVQKRKLVEVTITEGWFSEQELSSDFGWKQCMSQLTMNQLHHTITIPVGNTKSSANY